MTSRGRVAGVASRSGRSESDTARGLGVLQAPRGVWGAAPTFFEKKHVCDPGNLYFGNVWHKL